MTRFETRADCQRADEADPLAHFRGRFALPPGLIYLDGNSLGPAPVAAAARAQEIVTVEWGTELIRSWNSNGWFDMPGRLGDLLSPVIGGHAGQTVVTDSTSLNLFKVLAAAIGLQEQDRPGRRVIISERDNFPTDLYIAEGIVRFLDRDYELKLVDEAVGVSLEDLLDQHVAAVSLSHVNFRTGALWDMAAVTQQVHQHGALMIWDLAHSAGALPVDLSGSGVDFAVGCTYKYLNGGPGAPAYVWVNDHVNRSWQPLSGWWGHADPFAMAPTYEPAAGIRSYLCGTPPIISLAIAECGLTITAEADMAEVRHKSLALTDLLIDLVETRCADHPLTLITPREHERRGSHVSFRHPQGYAVVSALLERGVIGDYREPEGIRLGITPLYVGYADVWDAVDALVDILDTRAWDSEAHQRRGAVT